MKTVQLDLSKLLGFRIIANEFSNLQNVVIGAKLGEKEGVKTVGIPSSRITAKIGSKVGRK